MAQSCLVAPITELVSELGIGERPPQFVVQEGSQPFIRWLANHIHTHSSAKSASAIADGESVREACLISLII
jgi:hypothetical protein